MALEEDNLVQVLYKETPDTEDVFEVATPKAGVDGVEELLIEPGEVHAFLQTALEGKKPISEGMTLTQQPGGIWVQMAAGEGAVHIGFKVPKDPAEFAELAQAWQPGAQGYAILQIHRAMYSTSEE